MLILDKNPIDELLLPHEKNRLDKANIHKLIIWSCIILMSSYEL